MSHETLTKRYDLVTSYRAGSSIEEMEPSNDGEWVRWEDVQARVQELEREVARLKGEDTDTDIGPRTDEDSGLCCMAAHANAVAPWECQCPCHRRKVT